MNTKGLSEEFKAVLTKKDALEAQLKDVNDYIKSYRKICDHDFVCEASGSHKDYYVCSRCLEKESY